MTEITRSAIDGLTEHQRNAALRRFQILRPYLEEDVPLTQIAQEHKLGLRTVSRWTLNYRQLGLAGLCRRSRSDRDKRKMSPTLQHFIEGLALLRPHLSSAAVHREAALIAARLGEPVPCYRTVHMVIRDLDPALTTLAHEGSKAYSDAFDLVHRTETQGPNAIWQADHTELDLFVTDDSGQPRKPWLTVILDDYSRAIAGYLLFFGAPSAIQTALALRQAIWRKAQPGWHVCGIPQVLYTDHGSDFTSKHLEQVAADLKIRLSFSIAGKPRGRGKIERFFESLSQVCLSRLPGYGRPPSAQEAVLTLPQLTAKLEPYLIDDYLVTPHSTTGQPPQARWEAGGFLPQMPESLEQLDLLLLTVAKSRRVSRDGIRFLGMRYTDTTLAAYVGEDVVLRYDPRDVAEVRVFHEDRFLCRAVCQELAGATVTFREVATARNRRRRELRQTLDERRRLVDSLLDAKRGAIVEPTPPPPPASAPPPAMLKRYLNE
jgi:putative transposase